MDELKSHLGGINPKYDEYADPLWANGIRSVRQIAHASVSKLQDLGVNDPERAEIIYRDARSAGDNCLFGITLIYSTNSDYASGCIR